MSAPADLTYRASADEYCLTIEGPAGPSLFDRHFDSHSAAGM
jgi:hypothetical protein